MIKIVLFQPDNPQNVGAFIRLCACLGLELHLIEPCGFPLDDKQLRRVAMDYQALHPPIHHASWQIFLDFRQSQENSRLLLLTTKASTIYTEFKFEPGDMLMLGRESSGVPQHIHDIADARLTIPMREGARSLNVVTAAGMVAGEALRQTTWNI